MKTPSKLMWIMGLAAALTVTFAEGYPGENITLDPVTGNYIITYWDDCTEDSKGNPTQPELIKTTFGPATKIVPTIHSKFWPHGAEYVRYSYTLFNDKTAKQSIVSFSLEQVGRVLNEQDVLVKTASQSELESAIFANMSALDSPNDWSGNIIRSHSRIVWGADDIEKGGVRAGRTQSGFGFHSSVLPGISEVKLRGLGEPYGYGGCGPAEDSAILEELARLQKNDFVLRNVAAPTIAVPGPFDAAVLIDRVRTEILTWTGKQLLDPTLATQLDRYMVAAADAYRRNQTKAGKEHIETMREMLKREQKDLDHDDDEEKQDGKRGENNDDHRAGSQRILIDRLAARVLDFDLRYVLKRMEKEHEHDHDHDEGDRRKER